MRSFFLLILAVVFPAALFAQQSSTFFSTFDAERGNIIAPVAGGNLWLGGQKDERVLLAKLNPEGKILEKHSVGFEGPGLDLEHLTDLFEESDGTLVGCGNFEGDNLGRGFVFRYNPTTRQTLWAHVVRSGIIDYLYGITQLGPGGDYVLYSSSHTSAGDDVELMQLSRTTGQIVTGKAKRFGIGPSDNIIQILYHNGALYGCGRFTGTEPYPPARMRNAVCKIDTATLEPVWTRTGPLPTSSSGQFHGRDLIIDNETIVSTFSGDHASPDMLKSEVYLQKNDLDGNLLWVRQYKLPAFAHEFAEEIINLPDGYLLYGHDIQTETSRLFLLKTDKEGNATTAVIIDFGLNDEFPDVSARSKILRLGDALFFTALSENNLGQTQGILVKTDLNGLLSDSCDFVKKTPFTFSDWDSAASQSFGPTVTAGTATLAAATISQTTPGLIFEKKCGATGTCPTLPDLSVTLDSITCTDGNSRLHFTVCNVGGQPYDGPSTLFIYDQNPLTGPAKFITGSIGGGQPVLPGECISWGSFGSDVDFQMPYELDTFTRLYALIGANYTVTTPIPISGFPYPPNQPECSYLNNLDSISIPQNLCGDCQTPVTFVKKLGAPQRRELAFSMCTSADGNVYVAGKQGNNPMIAKITTQGEQIWVRNFPPINPNEPIEWAQIIEDSDGKIVVCGTEGASPSNRRAIAMRYDPVAGAVLWYKRYHSDKPTGVAIVEKSPGGDFVLQGNFQTNSFNGVSAQTQFFTLNRADGNTKGSSVGYQSQNNNIVIASTVLNNGNLYTVGSWVTKANDEARPFFARVSPNTFFPDWAYLSIPDTSSGAARWMPPADVAFDGDFAVIAGSGHLNPLTPTENIFVYLQKHNPDGSLVWLKRYDMEMAPEEVLTLPNAYIVFGRMAGTNRFGMLKTDLQGNVLRAAVLDAAPASPNSVGFASRQGLLLRLPLQLLMLDHTWENTESDLVLLRTDLNFGLDDDCDLLQSVQVSSSTLSAATEPAQFGIGTNTPASAALPANAVFQADSLPLRKLCPDCSCAGKPDITFRIESVGCDSAAFVAYRLCNTGKQPFTGTLQVGVYDSNPMTGAATLLDLFLLPTLNLAPDSCQTGTLKNLGFWGNYNKVYTLAGIESGQTTPVNLAGFPYNGIAECDYANNLDSLAFQYPPALLPDLGPDTAICPGDTLLLGINPGMFVSYTWHDGSISPMYPVTGAGIFSLTTKDGCGRTASDNIVISLKNQPKATREIVLLPGDSVIIGGMVYKTSAQVISYEPSSSGGCDTLVTNNIRLDSLHCDQPGAFFKAFKGISSRVVLPAADGGYYVGGGTLQGLTLAKFDATGKKLWTRHFNLAGSALVQTLLEDSEGMLAGSATSEGSPSVVWVFRYDPAADQMLWIRRETTTFEDIRGYELVERKPGGDYLLAMVRRASAVDFKTEMATFDRATGNIANGDIWRYNEASLTSIEIKKDTLYAFSILRDNSMAGLVLRNGLVKIDLNTGTPVWAKLTETADADLFGGNLLLDDDGNLVTTMIQPGQAVWLQKTAPDGGLLWLKKIRVLDPTETQFFPLGLVRLNDGYAIGIQTSPGSAGLHSYVVVRTDKNGNLVWAKKVPNVGGTFTISQHQLASRGNEICFTTNLNQQVFQMTGMVLGKFDQFGNLGGSCLLAEDSPVVITQHAGSQVSTSVHFANISGAFDSPPFTNAVPLSVQQFTFCSSCLPPCDSIATQQVLEFYPGDTIFLAGTPYTQSDTVTLTLTTDHGCDSVVTYILRRVITNVDLACPPDMTVAIPANQSSVTVAYPLPAAATNCPDPGITLTRLQGPASGGLFPEGTTPVCYEAANQCGIRDTCCFAVTAQKTANETACDVKTPAGSCIKYEILSIRLDSLGRPRYRFRLTNTCASPLQYACFQLPAGITAKAPLEGSIYTATGGNTYLVRNPNASPFHSVRFKSVSGTLNNGKSDIFEYTLPRQAQPLFILVSVKLADGNTYNAHLNTFACPVQPYAASAQEPEGAAQNRGATTTGPALLLWPNPTSGLLLVDLQTAEPDSGQPVLVSVLNAQGQLVLEDRFMAENNRISLLLPEGLANGLYYLTAQPAAGGVRSAARFVLER